MVEERTAWGQVIAAAREILEAERLGKRVTHEQAVSLAKRCAMIGEEQVPQREEPTPAAPDFLAPFVSIHTGSGHPPVNTPEEIQRRLDELAKDETREVHVVCDRRDCGKHPVERVMEGLRLRLEELFRPADDKDDTVYDVQVDVIQQHSVVVKASSLGRAMALALRVAGPRGKDPWPGTDRLYVEPTDPFDPLSVEDRKQNAAMSWETYLRAGRVDRWDGKGWDNERSGYDYEND